MAGDTKRVRFVWREQEEEQEKESKIASGAV